MKAVLISIQPKWFEKIARGEKTIEVRKSRPKLETPFKVFIYCTKGKDLLREVDNWHTGTKTHTTNYRIINLDYCTNKIANGKVIGEFVCDRIDEFHEWELSPSKRFYEEEKSRLDLFLKESCLTYEEICEYRKNLPSIKPLFGWHITDLKIYDKPKELNEFNRVCNGNCQGCKYVIWETNGAKYEPYIVGCLPLTRPPQSWCYVEAQE